MKVLVLNCGSSSLKYQFLDMENEEVLAKGLVERIGFEGSCLTHKRPNADKYYVETPMENHEVAVKLVMDALMDSEHGVIKDVSEIYAVGHRVVHGGSKFADSVVVDEDVKASIRECFDLGPLHNPANLMGIEACEAAMPGVPNVAVFDTAFGMGMSEEAFLYAVPYEYYEKYQLRRYGFHGTSHKYVSGRTIEFGELPEGHRKVIVCHLGNGASISASIDGKCVETSMGLTPLEGLVMGTRSGNVDPAVVQFIAHHENMNVDEVLNVLNKKSGVLGISGISNDFRDIEMAEAEGNARAKMANDVFHHSVIKTIGGYVAIMNGVDAIAFTAGVGENGPETRERVCASLGYLGVEIDKEKNKVRGVERLISTEDSKVKVFIIPTNEELAIARETLALVK